jgi:hypothetical protein
MVKRLVEEDVEVLVAVEVCKTEEGVGGTIGAEAP